MPLLLGTAFKEPEAQAPTVEYYGCPPSPKLREEGKSVFQLSGAYGNQKPRHIVQLFDEGRGRAIDELKDTLEPRSATWGCLAGRPNPPCSTMTNVSPSQNVQTFPGSVRIVTGYLCDSLLKRTSATFVFNSYEPLSKLIQATRARVLGRGFHSEES